MTKTGIHGNSTGEDGPAQRRHNRNKHLLHTRKQQVISEPWPVFYQLLSSLLMPPFAFCFLLSQPPRLHALLYLQSRRKHASGPLIGWVASEGTPNNCFSHAVDTHRQTRAKQVSQSPQASAYVCFLTLFPFGTVKPFTERLGTIQRLPTGRFTSHNSTFYNSYKTKLSEPMVTLQATVLMLLCIYISNHSTLLKTSV